MREITVDGFCGGGGWSTGFELAIGRYVDIGINHDADAIAMHKANHPHTKHYNENIFEVDPYMNTHYRKPDQIIQPYFFGDAEHKTTCLWLKNLPMLFYTDVLENPLLKSPSYVSSDGYVKHIGFVLRNSNNSRIRSKTFPGIAKAMAEQWGGKRE